MSTPNPKAAQAIAWGLTPLPLIASDDPKRRKRPRAEAWQSRTFKPSDWRPGEGIGLRLGKQPNGLHLYCLDIDSHTDKQDAPAYLRGILNIIPRTLADRLFTARSTGGAGRYIMFYTQHELPNGLFFNRHNHKAGEFLGEGRQVVYPEAERWLQGSLDSIPVLDDTELDQLLTACRYQPSHTHTVSGEAVAIEVDDEAVRYWRNNIGHLLNKEGLPKALRSGQTYNILTGAEPVTDDSQARYNVIRGLMFVGYDDPEIIALALHFCAWGRHGQALYADIVRCIFKENIKQPDRRIYKRPIPRGAPPAVAAAMQPGTPKKERGRPQRLTAEGLFQWYLSQLDAGDLVLLTRAEVAAELKVSAALIEKLERELRQAGRIAREVNSSRRRSWVRVLSGILNTESAPEVVAYKESSPPAEIPHQDAVNAPNDTIPIEETRFVLSPSAEPVATEPEQPDLAFDWSAIPEGRRKRGRRVPLHDPPTVADLPELRRRAKTTRGAARTAKFRGIDSQANLLLREALGYERTIAALEAEIAALQPPIAFDMPLSQASVPATRGIDPQRVPSKGPAGFSERDEAHASIARDLLSWGRFSNAAQMAREIADPTYRAEVLHDIRTAQHAQGVTP